MTPMGMAAACSRQVLLMWVMVMPGVMVMAGVELLAVMAMAVMAHGVMAVMAGVMVMAVMARVMAMAIMVMAVVAGSGVPQQGRIVKKLRHCHCPQWNLIRMDMMRTMTKNRLGCDFTAHSSEGS